MDERLKMNEPYASWRKKLDKAPSKIELGNAFLREWEERI
jgi:hypothetical protein